MFRIYITILFLCSYGLASQNYVWKRGSSGGWPHGNYGSKGIPSPINDPGARHYAAEWTDNNGNLWLFGGRGYTHTGNEDYLNDLWKYDVGTNVWTWMSGDSVAGSSGDYGVIGTSSITNIPCARTEALSWTDSANNLWLFGGVTYGTLNDLWKYNINTNEWTWISGSNLPYQSTIFGTLGVPSSSSTPGSRRGAVGWTDNSNNLWLFGGAGINGTFGFNNELWKFNISTNQWTWIKGSNQINNLGSYGTQGLSASGNLPPSRNSAASWRDNSGNFWLFGGEIWPYDSFDDLWKYNPTTNEWTWINGSSTPNLNGIYGTLGVSSTTNFPGARAGSAYWVDASGKLMLFGGWGLAATGTKYYLNDLWKYDPGLNEWAWTDGSNWANDLDNYGIQGVSSPSNNVGARHGMSFWVNSTSNIAWIFGGIEYAGTNARKNDLWQLSNCSAQSLTLSTSNNIVCSGHTVTLTAVGAHGYIWNNSLLGSSVQVSPTVATTYSVFSADSIGCSNSGTITLSVIPSPTISIVSSSNIICSGTNVTLTASGGSSYFWNNSQTGPNIIVNPQAMTVYSLAGIGSNGCSTIKTFTQAVNPLPTVSINPSNAAICLGDSLITSAFGAITYTWSNGQVASTTTLVPMTSSSYTLAGTDINGCINNTVANVTINTLPTISIFSQNNIVCLGDSVSLLATGANSYTWNTGESNEIIFITSVSDSIYSVVGTDLNGCKNEGKISLIVDVCLNIAKEKNVSAGCSIFPNPTNCEFYVQADEVGKIVVIDQFGRNILSRTADGIKTKVSIEELNSGIYFVKVVFSNYERTFKLVKN